VVRSGSFTIGSSRADVAAAQGVPTGYHASYWSYDLATIDFKDDRVVGWSNIGNVLRPALPGAAARPNGTFTTGSTRAEVLAVQGVPTGYHASYWSYDLATVDFERNRVKGWSNISNVLNLR
jgi:hypothetical protein